MHIQVVYIKIHNHRLTVIQQHIWLSSDHSKVLSIAGTNIVLVDLFKTVV